MIEIFFGLHFSLNSLPVKLAITNDKEIRQSIQKNAFKKLYITFNLPLKLYQFHFY